MPWNNIELWLNFIIIKMSKWHQMNNLIEHQFYHLPNEVNHINFILMCSNSQIKQMLDEEISCQSFILRKIIL